MEPTAVEWSRLYEAAAQFKKVKPWEWLSNVHLFGVSSPIKDETGYCCVMGNGGEMYGMAVYMGGPGLHTVLSMLNGDFAGDPLFAQHCYMLSFDNRDDLYPEEYKRVKELGFSYRGKNAWPTFRLYEPGYVPWPLLSRDDVLFLTDAIEQALEVSLAYQNNPDALLEGNGERFLVRVPKKVLSGWTSEWRSPEAKKPMLREQETLMVDELRMAKAKRTVKHSGGIWEVASFFVPMPIQEEGRPFYPTMNLIADQETGMMLHHGMTKQSEAAGDLAEGLLQLIETHHVVPALLVSTDEIVFGRLDNVIAGLGLEYRLVPELPAIEEFQQAMSGHLF
ncbi:DUF7309 domain-containing protein [Paenibacillus macerans]|uniref:DUF7309 domain-containing protein n=1 Tax=Paenibacillus macerans TaxID=44252 RepID=UPI003D320840